MDEDSLPMNGAMGVGRAFSMLADILDPIFLLVQLGWGNT